MSSFHCEKCGAVIADTSDGYITGCEHHPLITRAERRRMREDYIIKDMLPPPFSGSIPKPSNKKGLS